MSAALAGLDLRIDFARAARTDDLPALLGESPAPRETTCQGQPLQGEEPTADAMPKAKAADSTPPVYKNPEKARALIDRFKRGLVPH